MEDDQDDWLDGVADADPESRAVDRERTAPFLLRVFVQQGKHRRPIDYERLLTSRAFSPDEIHVFTWLDATLGEVARIISEVNVNARAPSARFSFARAHSDSRGKYTVQHIGDVHADRSGSDDEKSLLDEEFDADNDLLDVAII